MSKSKFTFDADAVGGAVLHIGNRAKNFDHSLITTLLLEFVEDNFNSEGADGDDGKWSPLMPSTLKRHPRRASGQMLDDSSILGNFQSVTQGDTSIVWSPADYATFHVTGTKHMDKRNPFAIGINRFMDEAERLIALEVGQ